MYTALPVVAMTLARSVPAIVPATPKNDETSPAVTAAAALAITCVQLTVILMSSAFGT